MLACYQQATQELIYSRRLITGFAALYYTVYDIIEFLDRPTISYGVSFYYNIYYICKENAIGLII